METAKGSTRLVHIYENHVIKYPRGLDLVISEVEKVKLWKDYLGGKPHHLEGLRLVRASLELVLLQPDGAAFSMKHGLLANTTEAVLGMMPKFSEILVPTRASVNGIVNIQDRARSIKLVEGRSLTAYMSEGVNDIIGHGDLRHTMSNAENYGIHEGRLKLLDYGDIRLTYLFFKYHNEIRAALNEIAQHTLPVNENPPS